jgi:hypothetical protein
MWFYIMIVSLIAVLAWLTRVRESFVGSAEGEADPMHIFKMVRGLLDKYDKPEIWEHALRVHNKDPGQLARMSLGINSDNA